MRTRAWCRWAGAAVILTAGPVAAQSQSYPFSSDQWRGLGPSARVEQYLGRESLYVENAGVYLADVFFGDGTIEVDVSSPKPTAFAHVAFRAMAEGEAEDVYLRMHSSGSPAAVQYAPVYKSVSAWQLQGGRSGWGRAVFDKNAWTHLKIELDGPMAKVYVNDAPEPALTVERLRRPEPVGVVALWTEMGAYYSNFKLTPRAPGAAGAAKAAPPPPEPGVLLAWELSDAFGLDSVQVERLPVVRSWTPARADDDGLLNISRFRGKPGEAGVVLARVTLRSERPQVKKLFFGYSDDTRVWLNGKPIFEGQSGFRSRDEQFMGTIGWKDAIYLDLRKGSNELVFAVAERFGGWGVQARLADPSGILP